MLHQNGKMSWVVYALLSAVFAALTAILAKIGVRGIDSNLATAIRTTVILMITWGVVLATGAAARVKAISLHAIVFLVLSGVATGLSWLFYFKALQEGPASKVAPIDKLRSFENSGDYTSRLAMLEEIKTLTGGALIVAGSLVLILP